MKKAESVLTTSNQLAAFLIAMGFSFRAVSDGGTIKIELSGGGLNAAMESFFANAHVPVQSYLMAFESLRSAVGIARERVKG